MRRPGPLPSARPPRHGRASERIDADFEETGPIPRISPDDRVPSGDRADDIVGGGVSGLHRLAAPARERPHDLSSEEPEEAGRAGQDGRFGRERARVGPESARGAAQGDDVPRPGSGEDPRVGWRELWSASRARRRALRAESRRFTARTRRRRWYWLGSLGAVVLLIAGTFAAAYSPLFAVRDIRVVGAESVDAADIVDALSGEVGAPMPLVDHSAIRAALLEFPLIETYQVESHPPHELVVRIVERTPVGVLESDAGFTVVDAAGVTLSTTQKKPKGQPVIDVEGGTSSDAFAAAGQVLRSLPGSLHKKVTEVTATSAEDVTLTLGGTNTSIIWGNAKDSAAKALALGKVMKVQTPDETSVYDVSSPTVVVVR